MKSVVRGILSFTCNKCGHEHNIPDEDADFRPLDMNENSPDAGHKYGWSHLLACGCGYPIEIDYMIWEYPAGHFSNAEIHVIGGSLMEEYSYDFSNHEGENEDIYDNNTGHQEW